MLQVEPLRRPTAEQCLALAKRWTVTHTVPCQHDMNAVRREFPAELTSPDCAVPQESPQVLVKAKASLTNNLHEVDPLKYFNTKVDGEDNPEFVKQASSLVEVSSANHPTLPDT